VKKDKDYKPMRPRNIATLTKALRSHLLKGRGVKYVTFSFDNCNNTIWRISFRLWFGASMVLEERNSNDLLGDSLKWLRMGENGNGDVQCQK